MENENFIKAYNGILARVYIEDENGNELCYIYELDLLKKLIVKKNESSYETFLNIGDIIRFSDSDFIVKGIFIKFLNETDADFLKYGINMYGLGEILPFNLQITYVVGEA